MRDLGLMYDESRATGPRSPGRRLRVLIADDQPEHLEMLARAIERSSFGADIEVLRADSGPSAVALARRGIDLAFLDIRMPGYDGFEVIAHMRDDPAVGRVPTVIVSSSSDPRDLARAKDLGVAGYVEKGRFNLLRKRIESVLKDVLDGKPL